MLLIKNIDFENNNYNNKNNTFAAIIGNNGTGKGHFQFLELFFI